MTLKISCTGNWSFEMKLKLLGGLLAATLCLPAVTQAGTVSVDWQEPEKFRDVKPANESKKRFRERTLTLLEEHFSELAEQLPADYELVLKVTDLDLAGNVEFGRTQPIRIVRQIFIPSIDFEYELLDAQKQMLQSAEVELKDMNFLSHVRSRYNNESLGYEKRMLDDWFKSTFKSYLPTK